MALGRCVVLFLAAAVMGGCTTPPMKDYGGNEVPAELSLKGGASSLLLAFPKSASLGQLEQTVRVYKASGVSSYVQARSALKQGVQTNDLVAAFLRSGVTPREVITATILAGGDASIVENSVLSTGVSYMEVKKSLIAAGAQTRSSYPAMGAAGTVISGAVAGPIVGLKKFNVRRVLFGTDRNFTGSTTPPKMFGSERGDLAYGRCDVSVPLNHEIGQLEEAYSWWWPFLDDEDPTERFVLIKAERRSRSEFLKEVSDRIRGSKYRDVLVFVHGYNVSFEDAARRTAQLAVDLDFKGPSLFYSWPSKGSLSAYPVDEQTIAWSQRHLEAFLADVLRNTDDQNIYLIAHSMGTRALAGALAMLEKESPSLCERIREVILAAPDIDSGIFKRDIAPVFARRDRPTTLYASSRDRALELSKKFHGFPRAGDTSVEVMVVQGVETIDASAVDSSPLGHGYFGDIRMIIADMFYLIRSGFRARERHGLSEIHTKTGPYWTFSK